MIRYTVFCVLVAATTIALGISALRYVTDFWLLAFVYSFQTHIGVVCIVSALLCLLLKRNSFSMILLVAALLMTAHSLIMARQFAVQATPQETATGPLFRLLSFNILNDNFDNSDAIADLVLGSDADVAYIFEAAPLFAHLERLAARYPYRIGCDAAASCDLMILSRRPFVDSQVKSLSDLRANRFAMVGIDLDGRLVHFAAAHLSKPYFDEYHQLELMELGSALASVTGPLILAGDFNSSMIAPDMRHFLAQQSLNTAVSEPATWPIEAGHFGISIDHVFARAPLTLASVTRLPDNLGSNHFGLVSTFVVKR